MLIKDLLTLGSYNQIRYIYSLHGGQSTEIYIKFYVYVHTHKRESDSELLPET